MNSAAVSDHLSDFYHIINQMVVDAVNQVARGIQEHSHFWQLQWVLRPLPFQRSSKMSFPDPWT